MSERILNFSEFFTKYSKGGQEDKASLDNLTGAAANFEEGFDKGTYDQAPLGPKKPIASAMDSTPPKPGEQGAPAFSAETEEDMVAPEEAEPLAKEETEPDLEDSEETTPEPEAGANPSKEEPAVDEPVKEGLVRSFSSFINESEYAEEMGTNPFDDEEFGDYPEEYQEDFPSRGSYNPEEYSDPFEDMPGEDEFGANPFDEDEYGYAENEYEYCDDCGEPIYHTVEGASCGCNM